MDASSSCGKTSLMEYTALGPLDRGEEAATECLLVIVPGFGIPSSKMAGLARAAQESTRGVKLWVSCMALDFMSLSKEYVKPGMTQIEMTRAIADSGAMERALDEVVGLAKEEGFNLKDMGWGRYTNVYVLAHSLSGPVISATAFKKANGYILLASTFNAEYLQHTFASLDDWSRPVLMLSGELDGQARWPWSAVQAYESAVLAQTAGPNFAAAYKPFVLVPGANHAQSTKDAVNKGRGDMEAAADPEVALASFGKAIGSFLTASEATSLDQRQAAATELLQMCRTTAELIGPYFMANGMGDVCEAWVTGSGPGPSGGFPASASLDAFDYHNQQQQRPGSSSSSSSGLPRQSLLQGAMKQVNQGLSSAVHPGVVAKAQRFAVAAQLQLASTLPKELRDLLRVVVAVHMDQEGFKYNQPLLQVEPDGHLVVLVHVLLRFNTLEKDLQGLVTLKPVAPEYWMKLKRPQAIAEELGLTGEFKDGLTAKQLMKTTIEAAVAAAPATTAARYKSCGQQLQAADDAVQPDINAEKFLKEAKLVLKKEQEGERDVVLVTAPRLVTPSVGESKAQGKPVPDDPYVKRFLGNWYVKVMSVAQAMEWVMLDCLREDTPWP